MITCLPTETKTVTTTHHDSCHPVAAFLALVSFCLAPCLGGVARPTRCTEVLHHIIQESARLCNLPADHVAWKTAQGRVSTTGLSILEGKPNLRQGDAQSSCMPRVHFSHAWRRLTATPPSHNPPKKKKKLQKHPTRAPRHPPLPVPQVAMVLPWSIECNWSRADSSCSGRSRGIRGTLVKALVSAE